VSGPVVAEPRLWGGWPVVVALGQAPFTAELRAAVYGRITRSSVTIAVTRSAGVTSKA
jgi:hypothetical protein